MGKPSVAPKKKPQIQEERFGASFKPENFIPGLLIGFIIGLFVDISKPSKSSGSDGTGGSSLSGRIRQQPLAAAFSDHDDLKMVFVVRQDLGMGAGKIASQCAHAATGIYAELIQSHRAFLLRQWERCGQAKIVVKCKNQHEMNKLKDAAESAGLPTFVVADAGRTQVSAGSKTVLAIGPGSKSSVDSVTGRLHLL
ncbi:hypothetical protein M569_16619 [Genlisea aurea]|uniref:peptidyl-tRNA hydrolase n=1 Tax=Genlisea aurea TaxID=192259 RepID=S8D6A0_9LAMI|nr:hypothetical protein M569_16619 [Genlisea aurea]